MLWRAVGITIGMLAAAGLAIAMKPTTKADVQRAQINALIPTQFAHWRLDPNVLPVSPAPDVQANLDEIYDAIVSRAYLGPNGESVMLTIAYGGEQSDSLKAHRQEVCYTAQGFQVRDQRRDQLKLGSRGIPVVRMVAQKGVRVEPVTYWFTMGDEVVLTRGARLIAQLRHGLRGYIPDGMLVRVSNISGEPAASFALHDRFVRDLVKALRSDQAARFVGTVATHRSG